MVMVERAHITKEMGYHEGIRDTSPYVVVKAKKKSIAGATKYNSHDPHKTTCAYSRGQVTLQLSKSRTFYFHLEVLRFFYEFPRAIIE